MVDAGADVYHVHKLIVCSQDMSMLFMGGLVVVMRMKVYHLHKPAVCSRDISMQFMGGLVVANGADEYHVHKLIGHLHTVYGQSGGGLWCRLRVYRTPPCCLSEVVW